MDKNTVSAKRYPFSMHLFTVTLSTMLSKALEFNDLGQICTFHHYVFEFAIFASLSFWVSGSLSPISNSFLYLSFRTKLIQDCCPHLWPINYSWAFGCVQGVNVPEEPCHKKSKNKNKNPYKIYNREHTKNLIVAHKWCLLKLRDPDLF